MGIATDKIDHTKMWKEKRSTPEKIFLDLGFKFYPIWKTFYLQILQKLLLK